ncbi:alpha-D-ribose 1-methylphosphonate 5-triphosphate diphosphatase [Marinovum sp. 2_MG-2023]|nr:MULTISPECIES: alpha-D-ribose 1-methylphosphonate 5-triphosphate diphosphatase [unclassified Marinovum]MDO6729941.1 alpha-D-ribose 1-methylphosphonate 5-triphosphate diphosphatase [Marinovum sp. 2_MG-2023]MDO6779755.1 alpha-D-ribose 1-methylphosphonate 5-triphosphate diphosphatase [Marinovum sp. 1_MG-2023]
MVSTGVEAPEQQQDRDFTLANARIVLSDSEMTGRVIVEAGQIVGVEEGDAVPAGAVDLGGDLLIPGLIELHTDNLERHMQPRPGVNWPHDAAILAHDGELASCGITTVFDALRVGSVVSEDRSSYGKYARNVASELLGMKRRGALRISHLIHLRAEVCSETLIEELAEFGVGEDIGLISLMDHTPGQRQFRDASKLREYLVGKYGLSDAEYTAHVANLMDLRDRLGDAHEAAAVAAARRLGAVLASHDDTTAAQVAQSADHGVRLAEFPTTEEAAAACRDQNIAIMMGAPNLIRGGSHSGNVAAATLAEAGLLDILSSDYVPAGLIQAAFRLSGVWGDLPRAIATVSDAPARAVGLTDRGRIAPGLVADLVRVRLSDGPSHALPVVRGVWSHGKRVG